MDLADRRVFTVDEKAWVDLQALLSRTGNPASLDGRAPRHTVGVGKADSSPKYDGPLLLSTGHVLDDFDCGKRALNIWLVRRALGNQASGTADLGRHRGGLENAWLRSTRSRPPRLSDRQHRKR